MKHPIKWHKTRTKNTGELSNMGSTDLLKEIWNAIKATFSNKEAWKSFWIEFKKKILPGKKR